MERIIRVVRVGGSKAERVSGSEESDPVSSMTIWVDLISVSGISERTVQNAP